MAKRVSILENQQNLTDKEKLELLFNGLENRIDRNNTIKDKLIELANKSDIGELDFLLDRLTTNHGPIAGDDAYSNIVKDAIIELTSKRDIENLDFLLERLTTNHKPIAGDDAYSNIVKDAIIELTNKHDIGNLKFLTKQLKNDFIKNFLAEVKEEEFYDIFYKCIEESNPDIIDKFADQFLNDVKDAIALPEEVGAIIYGFCFGARKDYQEIEILGNDNIEILDGADLVVE